MARPDAPNYDFFRLRPPARVAAGEGLTQSARARLERWLARRGVSLEDLEDNQSQSDDSSSEAQGAGAVETAENAAAAAALGVTGAL